MIQKPKGTRDLILYQADLFKYIINIFENMSKIFNYTYIQTPIFESYDLFFRSVGETTDVVNKEMFVFEDKNKRKMALRPENTAGVLRALIENKMIYDKNNKFYYSGSIFRYERPQKGRYREFTQIGVEWICENEIYYDFEILDFANSFLKKFKFENVTLKINNLGNKNERLKYVIALKKYFENYKHLFDDISLKRLEKNPLRIFDDKEIKNQDFIKNAPKLFDFLSDETKNNFNNLTTLLKEHNINFEIDYDLVRGFDYYTNLVFEFVYFDSKTNNELTILGGGRYANLIEELNGPQKEGIGFAAGVDRLMMILENQNFSINKTNLIFLFNESKNDIFKNLTLVSFLRLNNLKIEQNYDTFKFNKIFSKLKLEKVKFLIYKDKIDNKYYIKNLFSNKKHQINLNEPNIILKINIFIKEENE